MHKASLGVLGYSTWLLTSVVVVMRDEATRFMMQRPQNLSRAQYAQPCRIPVRERTPGAESCRFNPGMLDAKRKMGVIETLVCWVTLLFEWQKV